jgi:hypothetical protein
MLVIDCVGESDGLALLWGDEVGWKYKTTTDIT